MALRTLATIPAVTGDWALPGGGLAYSTSGYFRGDRAGARPRRPAPPPGAVAADDAARRRPARRRPAGPRARRLRRQPARVQPRQRQGAPRARARRPVHRGDRAGPDRHGRLRRHRAPVDDADRAPRRARRLRAHVPRLERAGGRAARRVPAAHGDLPPAGARHGPGGAGALRRRPHARADAGRERPSDARGRDGRAAAPRGLGPARPPASARAVPVRLPDAVGQARALLRARGRRRPGPAARATRRPRRPRSRARTGSR